MKRVRVMAGCWMMLAAAAAFAADPPKLPFTLGKETTVITEPLKVAGTPDYVAAINERYGKGVTAENNGFVAWLQAVGTEAAIGDKPRGRMMEMLGVKSLPEKGELKVFMQDLIDGGLADDQAIKVDNDFDMLRMTLWNPADHPEAAAFLKRQNDVLDRVVLAAEKPRWWIPAVGDALIDVLLPSLGQTRNAANLLAARAMQRAAAGDFDGFQRDVLAIKRLGRKMAGGATLIERLVGTSIDGLGNYCVGGAVGTGKFTEAQCKNLDEELRMLPLLPTMMESLEIHERWNQLELVQMVALGEGDKILNPANDPENSGTIRWIMSVPLESVDWDVVLRLYNQTMDEFIRTTQQPDILGVRIAGEALDKRIIGAGKAAATKEARPLPGETREQFSIRAGEAMMSVFLTNLVHTEELGRRNALHGEMAHLLILAAEVKAKTGKWPAKLEELTPAMIREIPKDLYPEEGPGSLLYFVTTAGATISTNLTRGPRFFVGAERPPAPGVAPAELP